MTFWNRESEVEFLLSSSQDQRQQQEQQPPVSVFKLDTSSPPRPHHPPPARPLVSVIALNTEDSNKNNPELSVTPTSNPENNGASPVIVNKVNPGKSSLLTIKPEKIPRPSTYLDPSIKYLAFLSYAGLTNQFMALENAAYMAQRLKRTLILPPITTNSHDKHNSNQRWSEYLNLTRFTETTGVQVVEWNDLRPLTTEQEAIGRERARLPIAHSYPLWDMLAEDVTCHVIYGYGGSEPLHATERTFLNQFLFRPKFVRPPERNPKTLVYDRLRIGAKDNLNMEDVVTMDDLVDRFWTLKDEGLLFLSHTFKLKDPLGPRSWGAVGQHLYFTEKVSEYAKRLIRNRAPETRTDGRYIAIHVRRGDIWQKCRTPSPSTDVTGLACIIPLGHYAEAVEKAQMSRGKIQEGSSSLSRPLPVLVTTDSISKKDHETMARLGWRRLNHDAYTTEQELGIFGPAMVDAWVLANAEVMVGTKVSTMTRVAARRQLSWHGHNALYPRTRPSWTPPV
ncbi:hypothetical protein BGZ83_011251 [Gryganskiella cystojenkinii]|nr:hypothetical protein BGZ83_011251 [Gryganskiella cystojenkinii]